MYSNFIKNLSSFYTIPNLRASATTRKIRVNVAMGRQVKDGTPCSYDDPHGICAAGKCIPFGCDYSKDLTKKFDKCGVCSGDNSQCMHVKKAYNDIGKTFKANRRLKRVVHLKTGVFNRGKWMTNGEFLNLSVIDQWVKQWIRGVIHWTSWTGWKWLKIAKKHWNSESFWAF